MINHEQEIIVDIGGGDGKKAIKEARENPEKHYFLFDSNTNISEDLPPNITITLTDVDFGVNLPFIDGTVDEVWINYLMGEVRSGQEVGENILDDLSLYGLIVTEIYRVLHPAGRVLVMDVKGNITYVQEVFSSIGFTTTEPQPVADETGTSFTTRFFEIFRENARNPAESVILPMEFVATK
jgi:hypothetical protein